MFIRYGDRPNVILCLYSILRSINDHRKKFDVLVKKSIFVQLHKKALSFLCITPSTEFSLSPLKTDFLAKTLQFLRKKFIFVWLHKIQGAFLCIFPLSKKTELIIPPTTHSLLQNIAQRKKNCKRKGSYHPNQKRCRKRDTPYVNYELLSMISRISLTVSDSLQLLTSTE